MNNSATYNRIDTGSYLYNWKYASISFIWQIAFKRDTRGAKLPQYCRSALTAARGNATMLIGQRCNPAVSQVLGTTHNRCASNAHREGICSANTLILHRLCIRRPCVLNALIACAHRVHVQSGYIECVCRFHICTVHTVPASFIFRMHVCNECFESKCISQLQHIPNILLLPACCNVVSKTMQFETCIFYALGSASKRAPWPFWNDKSMPCQCMGKH